MRIVPSLSTEYHVRGFDCGYGGPLRPLALLNFFQEIAGEHAAGLGLGISSMQADGKTWMLSRIDIRVDNLPHAGDRVAIETWPAGTERLFALRNLVMRDADGRSLVRAAYGYLIVDLVARRPLRPENFFAGNAPMSERPDPVPDRRFAVSKSGEMALAFRQIARARHLDNNGHVNNAHIANWLVDAIPRGYSRGGYSRGGDSRGDAPRELRVEFSAEILEGEALDAVWGRAIGDIAAEGRFVSELRREAAVVARAELLWA